MKKFSVVSGFLGAGKTTFMIEFTKHYTKHHGRAALISNDLGHGVALADHRQALLSGCSAAQITDECICFVRDKLADQLNAFYGEGCELVLSDIPGFGVGALEHVYHGLEEDYPGAFELGPFIVIAEPRSINILKDKTDDDMAPILRAQLKEADLIILNKCDLLSESEQDTLVSWLESGFPNACIIAASALMGLGFEKLAPAIKNGRASLHHPDIDYDDAKLINAMDSLTEYYLQYYAEVCCDDFNGSDYLAQLADEILKELKKAGFNSPHFKLLAWTPDGDYGKADILGTDRPVNLTRAFLRPCTQLAVLLNTTALCPAKRLSAIINGAVLKVSEDFMLDIVIHREECFNLGEG